LQAIAQKMPEHLLEPICHFIIMVIQARRFGMWAEEATQAAQFQVYCSKDNARCI
jgi:hypothetical protein